MRIQAFAIGLALVWATVGGARATEVLFTITGGDRIAMFELALNPTPNPGGVPGAFFSILSVPAVIGGSSTTLTRLTFWDEALGGGLVAGNLYNFLGPQLYTGSESSPTFIPGVYKGLLNDFTRKTDTVTVTELLPISDPSDPPALAVPELSTWAMLLLGFVGLGYAGYRKARTRTLS
jgi:hypothetical protein